MTKPRDNGLKPVVVRSTTDEVADRLRAAILSGAIQPGEHLPERDIGADLGVSNIALREAFGRLAEEGLIVRVPRRGAFAAPISPDFIRDLGDVRVVLEQHAVSRALDRWTPEVDAEITNIVELMDAAATKGDVDAVFQLDQEFHGAFLRASGSELLVELGSNLRGRIARSIRESLLRDPGSMAELPALHRRWLRLVQAREREKALEEVARHITRSTEGIALELEARAAVASSEPAPSGRRL